MSAIFNANGALGVNGNGIANRANLAEFPLAG
jgi:hypothetical protein